MTEKIAEITASHAIELGREAWKRIKTDSTWEDWVAVGTALEVGRYESMRRAGTNQPLGRGYNEVFSAWLSKNGFADIDRGTRSRLADCMENRGEIEMWRASLKLDDRLKKNHPNSVWRGWQSARKLRDARPARKNPVPKLEAAVENAVTRLENARGDVQYDLSPEHIDESARNFIEVHGKADARRWVEALNKVLLASLARRGSRPR